jgi:hypothetical protein
MRESIRLLPAVRAYLPASLPKSDLVLLIVEALTRFDNHNDFDALEFAADAVESLVEREIERGKKMLSV